MSRTTWQEQKRPFLEALARGERFTSIGWYYQWSDQHGLTRDEAVDMLEDLKAADYITIRAFGSWGRPFVRLDDIRLTGAGRRLLGLWPSNDTEAARLADAIVQELQRRVDTTTDEEERSKLKRVLSVMGGMGRDVTVEVLAAIAARGSGLARDEQHSRDGRTRCSRDRRCLRTRGRV